MFTFTQATQEVIEVKVHVEGPTMTMSINMSIELSEMRLETSEEDHSKTRVEAQLLVVGIPVAHLSSLELQTGG